MSALSDRDALLAELADSERRAAEREAAAKQRHAELLAAIEALGAGGDAATLGNAQAAKLGGFPTVDALRVAALRRPELRAARVGRGRWSRSKLIAAAVAAAGRVR